MRLSTSVRTRANSSLLRAGLDGNGRFRSPGHGISVAFDVLKDFEIVVDGHVDGFRVSQPEGTIRIDIAQVDPNASSPFDPPIPITNSVLHFSWYEFSNGKVEVVAYLS